MEGQSRRFHSPPKKKILLLGVVAALLLALPLLLGGCVTLSNLDLNTGDDAGGNHQISLTLTAATNATSPVRGVIAIRIPEAWDIQSVAFTGTIGGSATRSMVMEGVYSTEWEATAGAGHNGHKGGYKWWVGYSVANTWATGDSSIVIFNIDTHGRGGTYLLDFATGVADSAMPEDLADKALWQIGSGGTDPTGVLLDRSITLYSFTDVHPGAPYYDAIQGMASKGLITGYPVGGGYSEFRASNPVFRAQFAKMIDGALGLTVAEDMAAPVYFSDLGVDLPADLYPHEYVWVAYNNNIIKGYIDGSFRPFTSISRGHVVTMVVRALLNLHPDALQPVPAGFVQTWGNDLLPEHRANARIAEYNNLLAGLPLSGAAAGGNAAMPRGEVAQVLANTMALIAP